MEEQLISFETAKIAQQKGFNVRTKKAYVYRCLAHESESYTSSLTENPLLCDIPAPSQTILTRWLLENHNIKVTVDSGTLNMAKKWVDWYGYINTSILIDHRDGYPTKEQALEFLLKEALKLIKS